jgi:hypothetical protein
MTICGSSAKIDCGRSSAGCRCHDADDCAWMIHTVRAVGYRLLEKKEDEAMA